MAANSFSVELTRELNDLAVSRPRFTQQSGGDGAGGLVPSDSFHTPGMSTTRHTASYVSGPTTVREDDNEEEGEELEFGQAGVTVENSPGRKYRIFESPSAQELCGRSIGGGETLCIKKARAPREDCGTAHRGKSNSLQDGGLYVIKTATSVFSYPTIESCYTSADLYVEWLNSPGRLLEDWTEDFNTINRELKIAGKTPDADDEVAGLFPITQYSKNSLSQAKHTQQSYLNARTPNKPRVSSGLFDNVAASFSPYEQHISKESEQLNVENSLRLLDVGLSDVSTNLVNFMNRFDLHCEDALRVDKVAEARIDSVEERLGKKPKLNPSIDSPSLWGTIGALSTMTSPPTTGKFVPTTEFLKFQVDMTKWMERTVEEKEELHDRKLKDLHSANVQVQRQLKNSFDVAIQDLADKINTLESPGYGTNSSLAADIESRLEKKMAALEDKTNRLVSDQDGNSISFQGLGFSNAEEAYSWLEMNGPKEFGLMVDFHTVLEHVYQSSTNSDTLSRLQTLYKLKISTLTEGVAMTSFDSLLPKYFAKDGSHRVVRYGDSYFDKIANWSDWDHPVTGFRDQLKTELQFFRQSHLEVLRSFLEASGRFYAVCLASLTESIAFAEAFIVWFDDTFREYESARLGTKKAFHVVTRLAKVVMRTIGTPRVGTQRIFKAGNPDQIGQCIFWAVLRSQDEMATVRSLNFRDLPAVSSELVKFLTVNTGIEAIESLTTKVTSLEKKEETTQASLKELKKADSSIGSTADKASKTTSELDRRLKVLEKKG
jgi:hypothetical protein